VALGGWMQKLLNSSNTPKRSTRVMIAGIAVGAIVAGGGPWCGRWNGQAGRATAANPAGG